MPNILNQNLYRLLRREFGKVVVARAGEQAVAHKVDYDGKNRVKFLVQGEYYRINCPFCGETKQKLYINHRWGRGFDEFPGHLFWWAAHCFVNDCLADYSNSSELKRRVYLSRNNKKRCEEFPIEVGIIQEPIKGPVQDPGECVLLDSLNEEHPACTYIRNRGFDPTSLAKNYKVSFCETALPGFRGAAGRLIVPIIMDGEQLSWQGRYFPDVNWKSTGIPKYYNCPGVSKRLLVYGLDAAKELPFCIIVEGVTDVWALGPGAVCILGKSMSEHQFDKIKSAGFKSVVVMLDADAKDEASDLLSRFKDFANVVNVEIPENADPASMVQADRDGVWDLIYGAASSQGVDLLAAIA